MAKTSDFLSNISGKINKDYQVRQTDHGNYLAHNARRKRIARRSIAQVYLRCQLANLSAIFRLFLGRIFMAFEDKEPGQNDYNIFIQVNYGKSPIYLTKQERAAHGCVVGNYLFSRGSLNPIGMTFDVNGVLVTNLSLGSLVINGNTTVAECSMALMQNNDGFEELDQITFFLLTQTVDVENVPRANMKSYRLVLSLSDNAKLWSRVASAGFSTVNGYLGMSYALTSAGASWIHSRNTKDGKFQVSTQRIYVKNDLLTYYQSEAAMLASAASYGGINTREEYLNPQNTIEEIGLNVASASQGGASEQSAGGSGSSSGSGSGQQSGTGQQTGGNSGGNSGGSSEAPTVAAPTISGSTPFEETTSVTMSAENGATIYYTTDGSTPTSASTQYSSALTLSDTTTVKAIAVKDDVSSSVASKTFTKGTDEGDGDVS